MGVDGKGTGFEQTRYMHAKARFQVRNKSCSAEATAQARVLPCKRERACGDKVVNEAGPELQATQGKEEERLEKARARENNLHKQG